MYYPLLYKKIKKVQEVCDSDEEEEYFDKLMDKVIEYKKKNI